MSIFFSKISKFSAEICKICSREDDFLVRFEKCCKMRIWTRKSASILPRTSLGKSAVSWPDASVFAALSRAEADAGLALPAAAPAKARRELQRDTGGYWILNYVELHGTLQFCKFSAARARLKKTSGVPFKHERVLEREEKKRKEKHFSAKFADF